VQDRRRSGVVDPGESVRRRRRPHRVDRDLDVAVGPVLEPDRHREAAGELAVGLALRGAGPDRPPGDAVGDVLGGDRVEELAADRQPRVQHLQQQLAGDPQAGVDVPAFVQVRVVDQPLPAGRRPRLLEVDAHHHQQLLAQVARRRRQLRRVLHRRFRVVHAARPDHDHQPLVSPRQHLADFLAAADDRLRPLLAERQLGKQLFRRHQLDDFRDSLVADAVSFRPLHPDEHIAFAFLQTLGIVLSGRLLPPRPRARAHAS
jgi:hypothetical protein